MARELLQGFDELLAAGPPYDKEYLKDRNRGMILQLLDAVEATGGPKYIPILQAWAEIDYKKVQQKIHWVIGRLHYRAAGGGGPQRSQDTGDGPSAEGDAP